MREVGDAVKSKVTEVQKKTRPPLEERQRRVLAVGAHIG